MNKYCKNCKDCLNCANSFSEPTTGETDILHCMKKDGQVVNGNDYCEEWN